MSDFLPLESSPYWTTPRLRSGDKSTEQDTTGGKETEEHHSRHLNESLARFLHAFHLHFYGEPTKKDVQPRVDVVESKGAFTAYVELPGMSCDEVHVEANDHLFTVGFSGQLKRQTHEGVAGDIKIEHKGAAAGEQASNPSAEQPTKAEPEAEKKQNDDENAHWHISERKCGHFNRVLQLPVGFVEMGAVKATMANGLLTISVPKRVDAATKTKETARKVEVVPNAQGEAAEGASK